ncbi:hypothetical protein [Parapedobacter sp. 10938]|uniref:hypothetical protein n=1 Tax=Parapedobacter flavus TaxID=3110225 RepID=UPI002DBF8912|nr:hypothetical protein [Parapedobacter sp. 10938]MEC3881468.1 hypothetical protein [Parapedobacter sp. 10938]
MTLFIGSDILLDAVLRREPYYHPAVQMLSLVDLFYHPTLIAIRTAMTTAFNDIEDAVQYTIALANRCDMIITPNLKDYKKSLLPVMTAEQYLKTTLR